MRIKSTRPGRRYAAIPNAALRDTRISIEARGVLALLMSYSDNWVFQKPQLLEVTGLGRDKFERVMRELIQAGYVSLKPIRGKGGRVAGRRWLIRDEPPEGDLPPPKDRPKVSTLGDKDGSVWTVPEDGNRSPENQDFSDDRSPENPGVGGRSPENPGFGEQEFEKTVDCHRSPEKPCFGHRSPEKPGPGFSGPIRRPSSKKTNNPPNPPQGGTDGGLDALPDRDWDDDPEAGAGFTAFWSAYPLKVDPRAAREAWQLALAAGGSPAQIVEAAERYAVMDSVKRGYAKKPANWLRQRGWSEASAPAEPDDREEAEEQVAAFWAEKVKGKAYVPQSLSPGICRRMLDQGRVSVGDLRARGIEP